MSASAERLTETPAPRENLGLIGHENAERELRRLVEVERLPHAILLSGPRGIGKATLAFRLARFLLATSGEIPTGMFREIGAGGPALGLENPALPAVALRGAGQLLLA